MTGRKVGSVWLTPCQLVVGPQSWAVLLLGITLLPLVQQVKHRPAAKLGRAEWFTAFQEGLVTADQHIRLEDRHGWFAATALEQVALDNSGVDWTSAGMAGLRRTRLIS